MTTIDNETFLSGLQCHKSLWLDKKAGKSAISHDDFFFLEKYQAIEHNELIKLTKSLLDVPASKIKTDVHITHKNYEATIDLLVEDGDGYLIYFVCPSIRPKRTHTHLLAFWQHVLKKNKMKVKDAFVVHIDIHYVLDGKLDASKLLNIQSVKHDSQKFETVVGDILKTLDHVQKRSECPDIDIGFHCQRPIDCPFTSHCWKELPTPSVFDVFGLPRKTKFTLYRDGYVSYKDAISQIQLDGPQKKQADAELKDKNIINVKKISKFLSDTIFPLYFVDFEAVQFSIPHYQGTQPFQQIPFQYSIHYIEHEEDSFKHKDFLAPPGDDPRREFIEALLKDVGKKGTIFAFNSFFEKNTLSALAEMFPDLANDIMKVHSRIVDIATPFNNMDYYTKHMRGKRSIKALFNAVTGDVPYEELPIMNGEAAARVFSLLHYTDDEELRFQIKEALLRYCHMDTLAMVRLWQTLILETL